MVASLRKENPCVGWSSYIAPPVRIEVFSEGPFSGRMVRHHGDAPFADSYDTVIGAIEVSLGDPRRRSYLPSLVGT